MALDERSAGPLATTYACTFSSRSRIGRRPYPRTLPPAIFVRLTAPSAPRIASQRVHGRQAKTQPRTAAKPSTAPKYRPASVLPQPPSQPSAKKPRPEPPRIASQRVHGPQAPHDLDPLPPAPAVIQFSDPAPSTHIEFFAQRSSGPSLPHPFAHNLPHRPRPSVSCSTRGTSHTLQFAIYKAAAPRTSRKWGPPPSLPCRQVGR